MATRLEHKIVKTAAFQIALSAIDRCVREEILSIVIAPVGCGKTQAIRTWRARHANTRHVMVEATLRQTSGPALYELAAKLGVQIAHGRLDRVSIGIAESLARSPQLVIIDEADLYTTAVFEKLRGIWKLVSEMREKDDDGVAFPCILFGDETLLDKLRSPALERFHRRVGELAVLPRQTTEEIEVQCRLKWPDLKLESGVLKDIHQASRGSYGWLDRLMPIAADLARQDGQVVTPAIVHASLKSLLGPARMR